MKKLFQFIFICLWLVACESISNNNNYMQNRFFKILTPLEWQSFQKEKVFIGSELDQQDGFIHLSFHHQWNKIWQKFFNLKECYLLEIDGFKLKPDLLKIEANRSGGEEYPHYYGSILLGAVTSHQHLM